jgi:Zn-dependent peptidase ImmA (M78 family)
VARRDEVAANALYERSPSSDNPDVAGPVADPRAGVLRERYHALFADAEIPVPVQRIAEDLLGLQVLETVDLKDISGALYPATREIVVNAEEAETRRRFTLAHELGHWVCHCLDGRHDPVFCRHEDIGSSADRSLEREANVFAAELVMPEPEVRVAFAERRDLKELAATFGVSPLAMQWRLYSFELIDTAPA